MSQPEALREFKEGLDQLRNHCCAEGFPDATAFVLHSPDFTLVAYAVCQRTFRWVVGELGFSCRRSGIQ